MAAADYFLKISGGGWESTDSKHKGKSSSNPGHMDSLIQAADILAEGRGWKSRVSGFSFRDESEQSLSKDISSLYDR